MKRTPAGLYFLTGGLPNTLSIVHLHRSSTRDKDNDDTSTESQPLRENTAPPAGEPWERFFLPTLGLLCHHKCLDEKVSCLRVQREGVTQRRQLGALLQERLLQPVATSMEVLL